MNQAALGILTVFTLFIICMFLSVVINIAKIKYSAPKRAKTDYEPPIIYIDGESLKRATKKPVNKRVVPFEATLLTRNQLEGLKSYKQNGTSQK